MISYGEFRSCAKRACVGRSTFTGGIVQCLNTSATVLARSGIITRIRRFFRIRLFAYIYALRKSKKVTIRDRIETELLIFIVYLLDKTVLIGLLV